MSRRSIHVLIHDKSLALNAGQGRFARLHPLPAVWSQYLSLSDKILIIDHPVMYITIPLKAGRAIINLLALVD
jgi:hypothetical protein